MAGMASLRSGGLVRPNHLASGIGDGKNVFTVGGAHEHQALGLGGKDGEAQREGGEQSQDGLHAGTLPDLSCRVERVFGALSQ